MRPETPPAIDALPLTRQAHRHLENCLTEGDQVVDATAGNGHDTLFLARQVGATGHVWAFDIQARALEATRARLEAQGLAQRVTLIHAGHQHLDHSLPDNLRGKVKAVMFNLGYLPGGDHGIVTRPQDTLAALEASLAWLHPEGVISVMMYRGHPGGQEEHATIEAWLRERRDVVCDRMRERPFPAPVLKCLKRS
ncbi:MULTISPECIES: class I SAM-dependent methyltransferase [unclassified Ectothiorhodospira]|uniref:class I SAM-dependent methyltransferase n=1 Tax=unclassified Ectothiorhodospira TaxID=2684909 RepID=UPI001EE8332A|nr:MULTISPECIES: class I SAM-dependent methyltransferase [unclassified Ectothiorhodospira]MCG5515778.1 methyltransferase domain-containing protein [Ectothiorhodospira sp. 9100]MCG5519169.1 methyltransferase domain-containing protein [Ectothiorhodospira sp. 9905]